MKAVVFHGLGDIRLDNVKDPKIKDDGDAIVRLTASAICGTDLHMVRGTMPGMKAGTILGHEGIGIVEEVGKAVTGFKKGDRVVIPSTINCGHCSYCNAGYTSQCDNANPNGPQAGTAFFGGPTATGPLDGLQAEYARVPLAGPSLVKLPDEIADDQAILMSDIFPTGYFGADNAEIKAGDTVAVFGCGPVGLFAIASAKLLGAGRIFAVDHLPDRLARAKELGAEPVNFDEARPTAFFKEQTKGVGVLRAIDAVGVDAVRPESGPGWAESKRKQSQFKEEQKRGDDGRLGGELVGEPLDPRRRAVAGAAVGRTVAGQGGHAVHHRGVPGNDDTVPDRHGDEQEPHPADGNCPHRKYLPRLIEIVRAGKLDPAKVLSTIEPMTDAISAYKAFDQRQPGWIKVELKPAG